VTAREALERGEIRRLPFDLLPPTELFAARRRTDDETGGANTVIDIVAEVVEQRPAATAHRRDEED
ncbi:MAG: hypothetical protein ABEN55_14325, partial [Bradymonadaceae bacterium]